VVVGVDGSDAALSAVDVAAHEARLRSCPLLVVHAFVWPLMRVRLGPPPGAPSNAGLRNYAQGVVDEAVERAHAAEPDLPADGRVLIGTAVDVLVACARTATLVVIGDRGLGAVSGLVVGSVAVGLAAHARCPVLVVRGDVRATGPVVVGVDGSAANEAAVREAFATAGRREAPLMALHARRHATDPDSRAPGATRDRPAGGAMSVTHAVDEARRSYPDLDVSTTVVDDDPRKALIRASTRGQLVVVGARGLGGFRGLLVGAVSHAVLYHADCPVLVVPHDREPLQQPEA
jgi:nucleotide-binding universal stress UspA family protein